MTFAEKLKSLRKSQKLTQQELADRLGVAKSVVSYYESGDRFPSYDVLVKIAHRFHVTTDYLLDVDKIKTLNVSNLTDKQIGVITEMIELLQEQNE
ncbi:MAG: helix-turn-helix domain-containing protein [Roseburia sp. 1XD42-69]